MGPPDPKTVNRWVGSIVPIMLAAAVGYATYVFVALLCVNYLLKPKDAIPRPGITAALLTIYFILFLFMAITYIRLLYIVTFDPGYLPLGKAAKDYKQNTKTRPRSRDPSNDKENDNFGREYASSETGITRDEDPDSPGLELFFSKKIFVCSQDGRPKWCSACANWKPDRTHHCRDVGRCVYKMDHYCPWVGGVIGENSFKYFVQFVVYACLYCIFVVVAAAIYLSEQLASPSGKWQHQFVALLVLGGFFGLFTLGMAGSSLQFVFENLTTIENLSKKRHPWLLAVLVPPTFIIPKEGNYPHVTYPLPFLGHETRQIDSLASEPILSVPQHDGSGREFEVLSERDAKATKTFAILPLGIGRNPWDLGAAGNWKSVMGNNVIDWFLPIKRSPCCNHESDESQFEAGRWVEQLQVDVGFISEREMRKPRPVSGRHENRKDIMSIPLKMRAVKPAITAEGVPRNAH